MKTARLLRAAIVPAAVGAGGVLPPAYAQLSGSAAAAAHDAAPAAAPLRVLGADDAPLFHPPPMPAQQPAHQRLRYTDELDAEYDKWLATKKSISDQFNLDLALDYSFFSQWGTKSAPIYLSIYYPSATWRPFTDTTIGSGEIDIATSHQVYFSKQDAVTQATRVGLITFVNDWTYDDFAFSTLAYTHTLPDAWNWLSVTVGQYSLFSFDPNQYAANAQDSFISYGFAQDGTETFPYAGFGGYAQARTTEFSFAGGVQGGTDPNGGTLTADGFRHGRLVAWGNAQWRPTIAGLGNGSYSLLIYEQPSVPLIASHSTGVSFSASQELTHRYGAFMRINNATGPDLPARTSYAAGGVWNDPFAHAANDQLGLALGWDKTNRGVPSRPVDFRTGEWVTELFYKINIFKGMHITPDVQVFWNPALAPGAGPMAVFTLRTTVTF